MRVATIKRMSMRVNYRPTRGIVAGLVAAAAAGAVMFGLAPDKWWIEAGVILLVWAAIFLIIAWITRSKTWGIKISVWLLVLIILRRFGILDPIIFGIWLALLGLICLFN